MHGKKKKGEKRRKNLIFSSSSFSSQHPILDEGLVFFLKEKNPPLRLEQFWRHCFYCDKRWESIFFCETIRVSLGSFCFFVVVFLGGMGRGVKADHGFVLLLLVFSFFIFFGPQIWRGVVWVDGSRMFSKFDDWELSRNE